MKLFQYAAMATLICVFSSVLAAQADIEVLSPTGTARTNGETINHGKTSNGTPINYTVRIQNVGNADLDLLAPVVAGGGYKSVQVNMSNVPGAQTLTPTNFVEFDVDINPDKDSNWSFQITITSDDSADPSFVLKFKGTEGKPEDDDDDCSTSEGSGTSMLILLGILSAGVVATRLRNSRA